MGKETYFGCAELGCNIYISLQNQTQHCNEYVTIRIFQYDIHIRSG